MYKKEDFKVGQKLWRVNTVRYSGTPPDGHEVTILKVGHKFLTIKVYPEGDITERVHIENLAVDFGEYASRASCFLSQEHYLNCKKTNEANEQFLQKLRNLYGKTFSIEVIEQVEKLLEI